MGDGAALANASDAYLSDERKADLKAFCELLRKANRLMQTIEDEIKSVKGERSKLDVKESKHEELLRTSTSEAEQMANEG